MPSIGSKNWLRAKQLWIYAILLMSVGPVGPGGGIYSIIEDSLCQVYLLETGLEAKHDGYVLFSLYLWALSGPKVGYIQL